MAVNTELVKEWVTALRSGKYPQGTQYLSRLNDQGVREFCPLGVLCEILVDRNLMSYKDSTTIRFYNGDSLFAPREALTAVGILHDEASYIASINDKAHKSFSEIADYIEKTLLGEEKKSAVESQRVIITDDNKLQINDHGTFTIEEADKLAAEIIEAASIAKEKQKPWNAAPVGSYALVDHLKFIAKKIQNTEWYYVQGGCSTLVGDDAMEHGFVLLQEVQN